jgi:hypothetical protein
MRWIWCRSRPIIYGMLANIDVMKKIILALFASFLLTACQQDLSFGKSKEELAHELVGLMHYDQALEISQQLCRDTGKAFPYDKLVQTNAQRYGGLNPASEEWPDFLKAGDAFHAELCAHPHIPYLLLQVEKDMRERLTLDELQAAVAFYSSREGQKLSNAAVLVNDTVGRAMARSTQALLPEATQRFENTIQELARKAQARQAEPVAGPDISQALQ